MKTITGFLARGDNYRLLKLNELSAVKGGDDPGGGDDDPFKKIKKVKRDIIYSSNNGNAYGNDGKNN